MQLLIFFKGYPSLAFGLIYAIVPFIAFLQDIIVQLFYLGFGEVKVIGYGFLYLTLAHSKLVKPVYLPIRRTCYLTVYLHFKVTQGLVKHH